MEEAAGDGTVDLSDALYTLDGVTAMVGSESLGAGKLVLTIGVVSWQGESTQQFWSYPEIVMHAIAPSSSKFPACIYCHLDGEDVTELRFCPPDEGYLDEMFFAFNQGAELNPDANDSEDNDPFYFNPAEFGLDKDPSIKMHGSGLGMMKPDEFMAMITTQGIEIYDHDFGVEKEEDEDAEGDVEEAK